MKTNLLNKGKVFAAFVLFIGTCFLPGNVVSTNAQSTIENKEFEIVGNQETEYWALLVAVGVYADDPQQNRPLML